MIERTFDWVPRRDLRSFNFVIGDNFNMDKPLKTRGRLQWGIYLDQGRDGACTGFGTAKALSMTPKRRKDITADLARTIYLRAKVLDQWPGEDYEGSSVLAAMQTAVEAGWISSYYWATDLEQMKHAISSNLGAMVVGVNWYEGMYWTNIDGFITATGSKMGGHCVCFSGVDMERQAFVVNNSWGADWGGSGPAPVGSAYLSFADAQRLIFDEGGEAALMRKT